LGRVHEERLLIGDVPTRIYQPNGARGLLLLGHGGGHGKDGERFVGLSRRYAHQTGLAVVCIDAVDHGERRPEASGEGVPRGWHSRTAPRMVADWQAVGDHLSTVGPAVAYVGFSMGALFGFPTVAAMPTITAAVFVAGGVPGCEWIDDPDLGPCLVHAASRLGHSHVLMLNMSDDELFPTPDVRFLFESVAARSKKLSFWPGRHDDWRPDLLDASAVFVRKHAGPAAVAPSQRSLD
jgi:pimeloyl-ACP methyl ester carboxylesterase